MVYTSPLVHSLDEDTKVKELMMIYGIGNVRGGSYSNIILTRSQKDVLCREIVHAQDKCLRCGKHGHFAKECTSTVTLTDRRKRKKRNIDTPSLVENKKTSEEKMCCRCGRIGHINKSCNYSLRLDCKFLCTSFSTGTCGAKCDR